MRKLKYIVLGFTPLFAAAAFAQAPGTGIQDRTIVQAQAGGPTSSPGQTGGQDPMGSGAMNRTNEGKAGDPMTPTYTSPMTSGKDKANGAYRARGRNAKQDSQNDVQARKSKKQESKESGE